MQSFLYFSHTPGKSRTCRWKNCFSGSSWFFLRKHPTKKRVLWSAVCGLHRIVISSCTALDTGRGCSRSMLIFAGISFRVVPIVKCLSCSRHRRDESFVIEVGTKNVFWDLNAQLFSILQGSVIVFF